LAQERRLPYYFTCHDHHAFLYGKESECFKRNLRAIQGSIKSFVPAKYLVDYFNVPNLYYLSHGVNSEIFKFVNKNFVDHKLLCVANNGFLHNKSEDRKGFGLAIQVAKFLNLPITIAGPINNKKFFDENNFDYDKLNILYDLSEGDLVRLYQDHTIFLHPSLLEAGHPNLTLLEAMSCGLPVVGTYEENSQLPGLFKVERSFNSLRLGLETVISNYNSYKEKALLTSKEKSWASISKQLINHYHFSVNMKDELEAIYNFTKIKNTTRSEKNKIFSEIKNSHKNPNIIKIGFYPSPRVEITGSLNKKYRVKFIEDSTKKIRHEGIINTNMWINCSLKRFCDWKIEVEDLENGITENYKLDLKNKKIKIINESPALGDLIAWMPYVDEFRKIHDCEIYFYTNNKSVFSDFYPEINFKDYSDSFEEDYYAVYSLGFFSGEKHLFYTKELKDLNLQELACNILGLQYKEIKPKIFKKEWAKKKSHKKYVCIATQSTSQCKYWNNPNGWQKTVDYLNNLGYEVVCIDRHSIFGAGRWMNKIPDNCIDKTGALLIEDRIKDLLGCEFFIGLSSGLSWLAWACDKPVIMISGFTKPENEFETPYRIINEKVCNGCWNDKEFNFDSSDWLWCPRNKNFECSKEISFEMVKEKIDEAIKSLT